MRLWVVALAISCSASERPRQKLAPADPEPEPSRASEPEPALEPEVASTDQLRVWGAPPAVRADAFRAAVARVRRRAARSPDRFDLVFEPPFVVVGDGGRRQVERSAARTIRWAVERLKKAYFPEDPEPVLEIWLFSSKTSYRRNTRAIFGEVPDTPYGYYSPSDQALVMNIATGGGTLVHEIVHPFIEANVPDAPAWLNEGLGSLYEASSERDGHIVGLLNWRLPGLQEALRAGEVPGLRELLAMSEREFYGRGSGVHYAQARYLLYFLQQRDLLHRFYSEFLARRADDKTGYRALVEVLGERDLERFERRWRRWVLGLRYRR